MTRSAAPPGDAYTCALQTLVEMDYEVLDTDRASGFIRSEKDGGEGILIPGVQYFTEITIMVLPVPSGGSDLQITVSRSKQEGSQPRSTAGVTLTEGAKGDAARLGSQCSRGP